MTSSFASLITHHSRQSIFTIAILTSLTGCQVYVDDPHSHEPYDDHQTTPTHNHITPPDPTIDIYINGHDDERIAAVAVAALNLSLIPADLINHNSVSSENHAQTRLEGTLRTLLDDNHFNLSNSYYCENSGSQGVAIDSDIGPVESFYEGIINLNYDAVNCESGFDSSINGKLHSYSEWLTRQSSDALETLYGETHTSPTLDFYNDEIFVSFTMSDPSLNRVEKDYLYNEISTYVNTYAWVSAGNEYNNLHIQSIKPINFDSTWNSGVPIDGEILITDSFNHQLTVIFEQNLVGVLNHQNNSYRTYYLSDLRLLNSYEY